MTQTVHKKYAAETRARGEVEERAGKGGGGGGERKYGKCERVDSEALENMSSCTELYLDSVFSHDPIPQASFVSW